MFWEFPSNRGLTLVFANALTPWRRLPAQALPSRIPICALAFALYRPIS
jgi:hypothetical protein